jgi:hypothetical protein
MSALRHVRGALACGSGSAGVLVQYAEEPKEGGTRLRVAQSVQHGG